MPEARIITDSKGRKLELRPHPDVILNMDILEAAGLDAKGASISRYLGNDRWMGYATLACYVRAIDGVPVPMPGHSGQIKALVAQLGTEGIEAVAGAIQGEGAAGEVNLETAKN